MPFSLEFKLNCGYPSIETLGPLTPAPLPTGEGLDDSG